MTTKKVSYKNLLKEAISEFTDVAKHAEVKGPFLDGILKWDGGGELPTTQDAASILERYYFNENQDDNIEVTTEDEGSSAGASMKNAKGAGTEQAGTSDASTVAASKTEKEKDIAKEQEVLEQDKPEEEEEEAPEKVEEQEKPKKPEEEEEEEEITEDIENAVIEKLIAEMEEEEEEKEVKTEGETMAGKKDFDGVAAGMEAPKEKVSKNPEEDTTGAGTEQAGTGVDAGKVPNRKDVADSFVKPKNYTEQEDAAGAEEEEEEELDIDKKIKEDAGVGGPPIKMKGAGGKPGMGEDEEDIDEAFQIFKEQIEDEEEEEAPEGKDVKEQEEVKDEKDEEGKEEEVKV